MSFEGATDEYIRAHIRPETDPILREMERYAEERRIPVLEPASAAFLCAVVELLRPRRALEVGTAIGYSGMLVLRHGCEKLCTIELDGERAELAREYLARAGLSERAEVLTGDASEIVPRLDGEFDLVFMDGPKTSYPKLLPHFERLLRNGGALVADDVLLSGYVAGENAYPRKKSTIVDGLDGFVKAVTSSENFTASIVPVGQGMIFAVKK